MLEKNRKWFVLLATGMVVMLVNLDMTIVNLALADIAATLGATINESQWVITSYFMAAVLFFTLFGRLADMLGRKKVFLLGTLLFTLGSLAAGFSPTIHLLFIARFIQGLGFAATLGLSFVIILAHFPAEQRGLASGIGITITGLAQAMGPTIGGIVIEHISWPWIFWLNVPLGVVSLLLTGYITPKDKVEAKSKQINIINALLFIIGLGLIFYSINQLNQLSLVRLVGYLVVGLTAMTLFTYLSHTKEAPLVKVALFKNKGFRQLVILRLLFMMSFSATLFIIPLYLQNIIGYSPLATGLMMLAMTAFIAVTSPISGYFIDKVGFAIPVLLSMILALIAALTGFFLSAQGELLPLLLVLILLGIATGIHFSATIMGVNQQVDSKDAATAMGVFFTMALFGAAIGVALAGNVLASVSQYWLLHNLAGHPLTGNLLDSASGIHAIARLPAHLQALATNGFIHAYQTFMVIISALMLLAVIIAIGFVKDKSRLAGNN
jgi:EmrB/QacA subfamily drug resistance transporter